mgnify:CR=1 FL=1
MQLIENVLNRGLPRSPRARELCARLAGRRVAVEVRGFSRLLVESNGTSLSIRRDTDTDADAEISGGPFSLLGLAGESAQAVLQRGDVQISGDAELAQSFRELFVLLRPDVEEELSLVIGDVPAHQLGRLARGALGWTRRAVATAARDVAEYLAHERRDLVSRPEAEQFLKGVDQLREDVDRFEARLALLSQKAQQRGNGQ